MYTTISELKQEVRKSLKCPDEFITNLSKTGVFSKLKKAICSEDKLVAEEFRSEIYDLYTEYYDSFGLCCELDYQKARVGYFMNN